jgi:hypothetical protein
MPGVSGIGIDDVSCKVLIAIGFAGNNILSFAAFFAARLPGLGWRSVYSYVVTPAPGITVTVGNGTDVVGANTDWSVIAGLGACF